jgi:hypothetical protein
MRITTDRRIEVNEDVDVTEAAQKVLDALQHLLKPAPVQEPVAQSLKDAVFTVIEGFNIPPDVRKILESAYYNAPPAPQPVPVKTYHDGKPWPVAPKPWVGLTDEEVAEGLRKPFWEDAARAIEAKLKEKNHG